MLAKIRFSTQMGLGQVRLFHDFFSVRQLNPQLGLQFRLNIDMSIEGLPTTHSTATSVTNALCPIELPVNAG
jgi:hypothetical protein